MENVETFAVYGFKIEAVAIGFRVDRGLELPWVGWYLALHPVAIGFRVDRGLEHLQQKDGQKPSTVAIGFRVDRGLELSRVGA